MTILSKDKALSLLVKTIDEGDKLKYDPHYPGFTAWYTWARNSVVRTEAIFGSGSRQAEEITGLATPLFRDMEDKYYEESASLLLAALSSLHSEVQDLWSDGPQAPSLQDPNVVSSSPDNQQMTSNHVFIVHGHDHGRMQAVARFIEHLKLVPIVLHERANEGSTIVEKLEKHSDCPYALVLLTPDDVGSTAGDTQNLKYRARQNVILELGYFLGRLGRKHVCALLVDGVEVPSDYSGVIYIPVDKSDAWMLLLARELKSAGFDVDLNNAL